MSFGKWLLAARLERNLTQVELGRRAGISSNYVSALEREEPNARDGSPRRPRLEKVDKIAKALGKTTDEARLAAGYAPTTTTHQVGRYTIELPGDVSSIMLYDPEITDEATLAQFADAFKLAYEITKHRLAERRKQDDEKK